MSTSRGSWSPTYYTQNSATCHQPTDRGPPLPLGLWPQFQWCATSVVQCGHATETDVRVACRTLSGACQDCNLTTSPLCGTPSLSFEPISLSLKEPDLKECIDVCWLGWGCWGAKRWGRCVGHAPSSWCQMCVGPCEYHPYGMCLVCRLTQSVTRIPLWWYSGSWWFEQRETHTHTQSGR